MARHSHSTLRREKLLRFYRTHRRMPSYAEITVFCAFRSKRAAQRLAEKWLALGIVRKDATGKLLPGKGFAPVRLLGTVEAGFPSPAEEEMVDTISLDDWLVENKEASFLLKVTGDSMIDAGIRPGDMVILERGRQPRNGDIVVAEVDHAWTMKFFEKRGDAITLRPANRQYAPITPREELRIAGVVRAVIRKY